MSAMTEEQRSKCSNIINFAAVAAGGAGSGLAQLPCSDAVIITPIQIGMTVKLGSVFGIDLSKLLVTGKAAGGAAAVIGKAVSPVMAKLVEHVLEQAAKRMAARALSQAAVGWVPFVGNALNACTAAVITRELGWILADEFSRRAGDVYYNNGNLRAPARAGGRRRKQENAANETDAEV